MSFPFKESSGATEKQDRPLSAAGSQCYNREFGGCRSPEEGHLTQLGAGHSKPQMRLPLPQPSPPFYFAVSWGKPSPHPHCCALCKLGLWPGCRDSESSYCAAAEDTLVGQAGREQVRDTEDLSMLVHGPVVLAGLWGGPEPRRSVRFCR